MLLVSFLPNTTLFIFIKLIVGVAISGTAYFYLREFADSSRSSRPPVKKSDNTLTPSETSETTSANINAEEDAETHFNLFLETIVPLIQETIVSKTVVLLIVNYFKKTFYIRYKYSENPEAFSDSPDFDLNRGLMSIILKDRKALLENTLPASDDLLPYYRGIGPAKSFLGVPLFFNDYIAGILCADSDVPESFSPDDLQILQNFGDLIGIQLAASNKLFEFESENRIIRLLFDFSKDLMAINDTEALWNYVCEKLSDVFESDRLMIISRKGENRGYISHIHGSVNALSTGYEFPDNEGVIGWVLRKNQSLMVEDFSKKENYIPRFQHDEPQVNDIQSLLAVPVSINDEATAIISVESVRPGKFDNQHKKIMETFAFQIAAFLGKIQSIERLQKDNPIDPYTRLGNETAFLNELNKEVERSRAFQKNFSLQLLRIRASNYDDGAAVDQQLAKEFITFTLPLVNSTNYIFRLEKNLFALIWPEAVVEEATASFEDIYEKVAAKKPWVDGLVEQINMNCGFIQYPATATSAAELIEKVQGALTLAEQKGPNTIETYKTVNNF